AVFRRTRLDDRSEYYATPLGVDGHVIICSSGGTVFVLEAADEFKVVRSVDFEERIFATPAVVDGTMYLRTQKALYAFGSDE
ncbi:MAG: PQQ-binding-like beta-propeller repeat protein, partial [Planctomycetota bacterium]